MDNKVWVTWKDAAGKLSYGKVVGLANNADVDDLRRLLVQQQNLQPVSPATLSISETEGGEKLKAGKPLEDYFVPAPGTAFLPGPGQSDDTALVVTFPPPPPPRQQQQPNRHEYMWETIIDSIPHADLSRSGVVTGWRREDGKTTMPKLYLRDHLLERMQELDGFMSSENKRLYVTGPPGCGKTSFFLLWFSQVLTATSDQRALLVQYRETIPCEIMIIEDSKIKRVASPAALNPVHLLDLLEAVLQNEATFDYFMFDGVRQSKPVCSDVLALLNSKQQKAIHITSLQFDIKDGDGSFANDQYMKIHSWDLMDYKSACSARLKTKEELVALLVGVEAGAGSAVNTQKDDEDNEHMENDDERMEVGDDEQMEEARLLTLLENKFYYAGGSVRFMFEYSMESLLNNIFPNLLSRMTDGMWKEFSTLRISTAADAAVNSLMQTLGDKLQDSSGRTASRSFPVSKYILHKAYEHRRREVIDAVKVAAENAGNPVLKGWAFELDQIDLIRMAINADTVVAIRSCDRSVILPTSKAEMSFDGRCLRGDIDGSSFFIQCLLWNQGCFDIAFYHKKELVTIQFTVRRQHNLKINFIRFLKRKLEGRGLSVDRISHIAIVKDPAVAGKFEFEEAQAAGYPGASESFKIGLYRSTQLTEQVENGRAPELRRGEHLKDVTVYPGRKSTRRKIAPD